MYHWQIKLTNESFLVCLKWDSSSFILGFALGFFGGVFCSCCFSGCVILADWLLVWQCPLSGLVQTPCPSSMELPWVETSSSCADSVFPWEVMLQVSRMGSRITCRIKHLISLCASNPPSWVLFSPEAEFSPYMMDPEANVVVVLVIAALSWDLNAFYSVEWSILLPCGKLTASVQNWGFKRGQLGKANSGGLQYFVTLKPERINSSHGIWFIFLSVF